VKFLLDVCAGGRLRTWSEGLGYDVVEVRSRDPFLSDEEVLAWAWEEKRIVVTVDKDFGELAVKRGEVHCGIIRLPDVFQREKKFDATHPVVPYRRFGDWQYYHGIPHARPRPPVVKLPFWWSMKVRL
jgi:predicted nuclease of predicted toxin-antitoxin system